MRLVIFSLAFVSVLAIGAVFAVGQSVSNVSAIPAVTSSADSNAAVVPVQWYTYRYRYPRGYGYTTYPYYNYTYPSYGYTYPNYGYTYPNNGYYSYRHQYDYGYGAPNSGYYSNPYSCYYSPNGTYYQAARPYYFSY